MLKVLVVDDEPLIREGLKTIIDWNGHGFEICGEAENGMEGIQKVKELRPDLVIADVKMPKMGGLEMIQQLRKNNQTCKAIILTAYADFQYAQKAIELGVDSYIVKPIEQDELIERIRKVKEDITDNQEMEQYLGVSISLSKDRAIQSIINGQIKQETMKQYNKLYDFGLPWGKYQVILIGIDQESASDKVYKREIRREVEQFICERQYGYVFDIEAHIGVLLRNLSFTSQPRIFTELQGRIRSVFDVDLIISLGAIVEELDEVPISFQKAHSLIDQKFLYGNKSIIMGFSDSKKDDNIVHLKNEVDMMTVINRLCDAMEVNNTNYINDLLEQVKNQCIAQQDEEEMIKLKYVNMYDELTNKLVLNNNDLRTEIGSVQNVINEVHSKKSLQELNGYIKYKIMVISEKMDEIKPKDPMIKLLHYIDKNYYKELKLKELAKLFNYNGGYLGKLFKTTTGNYFNTYLDKIRIKKAKQFLKEGYKVYEVAQMTGYNDVDYFYRKFKKYVGLPPSDFRSNE